MFSFDPIWEPMRLELIKEACNFDEPENTKLYSDNNSLSPESGDTSIHSVSLGSSSSSEVESDDSSDEDSTNPQDVEDLIRVRQIAEKFISNEIFYMKNQNSLNRFISIMLKVEDSDFAFNLIDRLYQNCRISTEEFNHLSESFSNYYE